MNEKEECFAYRRGKCKALTVKKCPGVDCSFYKTNAQLEKERQQAFQRIKSLGENKRKHIINTYYGGKMDVLEVV